MKFELYKDMVLARDLPEERLKRCDIVKLVEHHVAPDGEDGYSAEVFNSLGETLTVITVPESALEALREDEVCCVRSLEKLGHPGCLLPSIPVILARHAGDELPL